MTKMGEGKRGAERGRRSDGGEREREGRCSEGQKFDTKAGENGARHGGRLVGWY